MKSSKKTKSKSKATAVLACPPDERPRYRVVVFGMVVLTLIVDQASKHIATFQGLVNINTGISFGLFSGWLLTVALIMTFIALFEWSCPRWHKPYPWASGLLLGGALSNIVDRIVIGGVRDFLPVPFLSLHNNVADWAIILALAWIIVQEGTKQPRTK